MELRNGAKSDGAARDGPRDARRHAHVPHGARRDTRRAARCGIPESAVRMLRESRRAIAPKGIAKRIASPPPPPPPPSTAASHHGRRPKARRRERAAAADVVVARRDKGYVPPVSGFVLAACVHRLRRSSGACRAHAS
ncbi:hypothetical protein FGB62_3g421 [Gracilaria domingensis]|nr:hypothetical protein FGB62_3g421 [Gracilaria domingensis]